MKSQRRRYRLLADLNVQGKIILRLCIAWMACQFTMVATILGFLALEGADPITGTAQATPWRFIIPAVVASSVVLPIVLLDMLIFTNKFAGPLHRFRQHLRLLAQGQVVSKLYFRPGDLFTDLSNNFNMIHARLCKSDRADGTSSKAANERIPQSMGANN